VRGVFRRWFPKLMLHYFNEKAGAMPRKRAIRAGDVVFGHFNRLRGFGIEDYYPQADQFITILRDPFEMAVSDHFFRARVSARWKSSPALGAIEEIVSKPLNMLNHFPVSVTFDNYRSVLARFLYIGITERMDDSMRAISTLLKKDFIAPGTENVSERTRDTESLRAEFERNHPLEHLVYRHAVDLFHRKQEQIVL